MTIKEYFLNDRFAATNSMELVEWRIGYAKVRMTVEEKHCNAVGFCQGGAIFTLADFAFAVAVNSHRTATVATNANITFTRSAKLGEQLTAEAREVIDHRRLPYAEVKVTDGQGNLVATVATSGYRKEGITLDFEL